MVARDAPVIPRPVCFRNARRLTSDGAAVLVRSSMPGSPRSSPDGERAERFGECRRRPARCQYSTAGGSVSVWPRSSAGVQAIAAAALHFFCVRNRVGMLGILLAEWAPSLPAPRGPQYAVNGVL